MKKCPKCEQNLPATFDYFYSHKGRLDYVCKKCSVKSSGEWAKKNKVRHNQHTKKEQAKLKIEVLSYYSGGNPSCACCGESHTQFLAIDHINGGGNRHKRALGALGARLYRWLKKNNYPNGFRVLCHNCNTSRGLFGFCPHQKVESSREGSLCP